MNRRSLLFLALLAGLIGVGAMSGQKKTQNLLVLDWAAKSSLPTPPFAILLEMGLKDESATDYSGSSTVTGAKVVHREGYRFRKDDKLIEPNSWNAGSHRPLRLPPRMVVRAVNDQIATVGVVMHLADVQPDAAITVQKKDDETAKATVAVKDLLAGKPQPIWNGHGALRLISTATPVVTAKTEDDFPAAAYGPDGTLWVAYISYTNRDESRRIEQHALKEQPKDFKAFYTPEFADQLFVKYYRDGKWSEPIAVTGPKEDLVRCAIAVESDGNAWVAYSANRRAEHQIYCRPLSKKLSRPGGVSATLGPEQQLTSESGSALGVVMCMDQGGQVRATYQHWDVAPRTRSGENDAAHATFGLLTCADGKWTSGLTTAGLKMARYYFGGEGNTWYPAIAAAPNGTVAAAYDSQKSGDYDIGLHFMEPRSARNDRPLHSSRFEARPSIVYDEEGRLWIACEESAEKWGMDYGALDANDGSPLYRARSVRVVCLQDGKLFRPVADLPSSSKQGPHPDEKTLRYAYPKIGIDGKGRIWLTYRQKGGTRYTTHPGSYWLTYARRLDGDHWSEPIELHHSDGLLDSRPVLLPHKSGGLLVIHNTDGRYTTPESIDNNIYMSYLDLPGEPVEPKLVPHDPGKKDPALVKRAEEENAAVKRIRDYRIDLDGKKYQPLRGEFHRHTEISWDCGPDGSLEDMWRYAIDVAQFDWIGNADHDSGAGREYSWWLIQKFTDAYHVKNHFTPMFTYERSVAYPHGHRNCMFAQRGVRTLPRLAPPAPGQGVAGVHPDDTKMLYRYLHELGGICASHTSATGMGTDWRDNDPQVEPAVEIYQGDRMSYEYEGAPRSGYDPQSKKLPAQIGGWQPLGFLNHALKEKGYRLGFESSSDHWSTHISYTVVLAERHDREAILDAMKKRHVYAATDNIILDVRSGKHIMGDEFKTNDAPKLDFTVIGTKPLARIDILKDHEVVESIKTDKQDYKGTWTDPKAEKGVHYYYVRALQSDDEIAWSSPMWMEKSD
jgi:hypothetical protein